MTDPIILGHTQFMERINKSFIIFISSKSTDLGSVSHYMRLNFVFLKFSRILPLDEFFYVAKSFQILQNQYKFSVFTPRITTDAFH